MIEETLRLEETRFRATLDRGLRLLDDELTRLPDGSALPGETAFRLYDTYGFPLDLTQDALREQGRDVDVAGFEKAMAEQRARARAAWTGSGETADAVIWLDLAQEHGATDFIGYDDETAEGQILALVRDGAKVAEAAEGAAVQIVLNQTPFYAEAGGQVGDTGELKTETATVRITDVRQAAGVSIHYGNVEKGKLQTGQAAELMVDRERRAKIRANHSATHLLNEALRETLGDHVAQRGSLNDDKRLRFDFSHNKALSRDELDRVAETVNFYIRQNTPVETRIMTPDDARAIGAQALFGEKYGDEVRVVSMGRAETGKGLDGQTWSIELCGGTHVNRTGDIGVCVILGDSASSAGVRRVEALTGAAALEHIQEQSAVLADAAAALKAPVGEIAERAGTLVREKRALENEVSQLRRDLAMRGDAAGGNSVSPRNINGVNLVSQVLKDVSSKDLPSLIDEHKARLGSGVVLLISDTGGKVAVAAGVTKDLAENISAVDLVRASVAELGGKGGGGRPELAQGGGQDIGGAEKAIAAVEKQLGG